MANITIYNKHNRTVKYSTDGGKTYKTITAGQNAPPIANTADLSIIIGTDPECGFRICINQSGSDDGVTLTIELYNSLYWKLTPITNDKNLCITVRI